MNKKILVVLLLAGSYLNIARSISAHELSKFGTIEGTLHISPSDQPIAQQLSKIQIEIIDINRKFDFEQCSCTLQIDSPLGTAAELPLDGSGTIADSSYTFATHGEHKLILKGEAYDSVNVSWEPFELTYAYEVQPSTQAIPPVSETDENNQGLSIGSTVGTVMLTLLVIVSVFVLVKRKSRSKQD
ncbi:MAG: hypothetical protein QG639_941 [Patescibacteria group bacterium]|jgi:hypothetical protein|nr:hypothetical protein [Patescibacteria group bacterium]